METESKSKSSQSEISRVASREKELLDSMDEAVAEEISILVKDRNLKLIQQISHIALETKSFSDKADVLKKLEGISQKFQQNISELEQERENLIHELEKESWEKNKQNLVVFIQQGRFAQALNEILNMLPDANNYEQQDTPILEQILEIESYTHLRRLVNNILEVHGLTQRIELKGEVLDPCAAFQEEYNTKGLKGIKEELFGQYPQLISKNMSLYVCGNNQQRFYDIIKSPSKIRQDELMRLFSFVNKVKAGEIKGTRKSEEALRAPISKARDSRDSFGKFKEEYRTKGLQGIKEDLLKDYQSLTVQDMISCNFATNSPGKFYALIKSPEKIQAHELRSLFNFVTKVKAGEIKGSRQRKTIIKPIETNLLTEDVLSPQETPEQIEGIETKISTLSTEEIIQEQAIEEPPMEGRMEERVSAMGEILIDATSIRERAVHLQQILELTFPEMTKILLPNIDEERAFEILSGKVDHVSPEEAEKLKTLLDKVDLIHRQ